MNSMADPDVDTDPQKKTYLALGDSYTIGESVAESEGWPVVLVKKLNENGYSFMPPEIIARTGWTTHELQTAIAPKEVETEFDLVSLLIGVNNQYRGQDVEIYEKEFAELLETAIDFAGGDPQKVFVVSIPDYGVTPFGQRGDPEDIAREIDDYNQIAKQITEDANVRYFNITPISRTAAEDHALVAYDGLHPSGKMYLQWSEIIFPGVEEMLGEY